ncbi:hypothetical protein Tco_1346557 [Tanacetum coccineum]
MQITHVAEEAATMPHDSPLLRVHSLRSDEGSITLNELTGRHEHGFKEPDFEFIAPEEDYTIEPDISTANVPVSTAGAEVSTASPEVKTAAESLVYIRRSATKIKDKGKAIMKEAEPVQKKTKQRIARVHEEASTFNAEEWDNIQAQIEADEELAHRLQAQERERYSEADKARLLVELINERKRKFAQQRAEQRRNKPMTQAQQRTCMCNYIKHMGSHTLQQLKKLSFDEFKELFETTMKRVNTFTPMKSDDIVPKVVAGSSKIDAEQELNQERDDLVKLWSLVHERFNSTEATEDKERELWVELKRLFEPNDDDTLWKLLRYMHDPLIWRLYDTCAVHHVSTERGRDIFMLVKKYYPLTRALMTLMLIDGDEDDKFSANAFADCVLNDDGDDTRSKLEPRSHKKHPEHVSDDDDEQKNDEAIEKEKEVVEIVKETNVDDTSAKK